MSVPVKLLLPNSAIRSASPTSSSDRFSSQLFFCSINACCILVLISASVSKSIFRDSSVNATRSCACFSIVAFSWAAMSAFTLSISRWYFCFTFSSSRVNCSCRSRSWAACLRKIFLFARLCSSRLMVPMARAVAAGRCSVDLTVFLSSRLLLNFCICSDTGRFDSDGASDGRAFKGDLVSARIGGMGGMGGGMGDGAGAYGGYGAGPAPAAAAAPYGVAAAGAGRPMGGARTDRSYHPYRM
mmetsp:Transcript_41106/g.103593  ORF Transcript_41106/g.103593 Transcript_41106/m.103593 type:complete len:242 (-) Transcript_41106:161-886(-)